MGWLEDLTGGIEKATGVVEDVGELAGSVRQATQKISSPSGLPNLNVVATNIQAAIDRGETLTPAQQNNKRLCESKGWIFYPAGGVYSMDTYSSGGGTNAGIQTVGLFEDVGTSVLSSAATSAIQNATQGGVGGLPVPWFKGPGGALQMPWSDPRIPEYLKQFALDDAYLKTYVRAPRGYVIVRDASGRPFAVLRQIARQFGIWKPAAKPPISATDWKHYKRNKVIERKLVKIARPALRAHSRPSKTTKKGR